MSGQRHREEFHASSGSISHTSIALQGGGSPAARADVPGAVQAGTAFAHSSRSSGASRGPGSQQGARAEQENWRC